MVHCLQNPYLVQLTFTLQVQKLKPATMFRRPCSTNIIKLVPQKKTIIKVKLLLFSYTISSLSKLVQNQHKFINVTQKQCIKTIEQLVRTEPYRRLHFVPHTTTHCVYTLHAHTQTYSGVSKYILIMPYDEYYRIVLNILK